MVSGMVTDWPGCTVTRFRSPMSLTVPCHRSVAGAVTAVSNAFVCATKSNVAEPATPPPAGVGPSSDGAANHRPGVTGLAWYEPIAVVPLVVDGRSGSPANGPKSNIIGCVACASTATPLVSDGTSHTGEPVF